MSTPTPSENVVSLLDRNGALVQHAPDESVQDWVSQLPPEVQELVATTELRTLIIQARKVITKDADQAESELVKQLVTSFLGAAGQAIQLKNSIANEELKQLAENLISPLIERLDSGVQKKLELAQAEFDRVLAAPLTDELYIKLPDPVPEVEYEEIKLTPTQRFSGKATVPVNRFDNRRRR